MARIHITSVLLIVAVMGQVALATMLKPINPAFDVLPPVPTPQALAASSFGDRQLLYRSLVLDLQNFGDTGGHWTPLKDYGMPKVVRWLETLDLLDIDAAHHMVLATRYFGQTQNTAELNTLIRYLSRHVAQNPAGSWPYLRDAIYLAQTRLKDRALMVSLGDQLGSYDFPDMAAGDLAMPALMRYRVGDYTGAVDAMRRIKPRIDGHFPDEDTSFVDEVIRRAEGRANEPDVDLLRRR